MATRFIGSCVLVLILNAMGCGNGGLPETVSVTGTVTYKSDPVEGAQVVLNNTDSKGKPASGVTEADGSFTLQTYVSPTAQAKGAMPGSYKVTVTKVAENTMSSEEMMKASAAGNAPTGARHLLPEKYSKVGTTDLPTVEIKKGSSTPLQLDLKD